MGALTLSLILFAATPAEFAQARADRASFPPEHQCYLYYMSLSDVPDEDKENLAAVTKFIVPSMSRKTHLPSQLPVRVGDLLRIDTQALGWEHTLPAMLIKHYPYDHELSKQGYAPGVFSALWFVAQVTDPIEVPDGYYSLLYGKSSPRNLKEFHAFWKVQQDRNDFIGYVEGQSGVALTKKRIIENHDTGIRTQSWSTYDSSKDDTDADPLENLVPGTLKFEAGEHIVLIPKQSSGKSGALMAFFLADAQGNKQDKAPANIVADHVQTRGVEIRNFVSCIACHPKGITPPTLNEYDRYLRSGATIYAKDRVTQEAIEAYLQSDIAKEIRRGQEEYAAAVDMCCGMTPEEISALYVGFVKAYDAEVDLAQAARALGCEPEELKLAIGYASSLKEPLSARLAQLAHGLPMPRGRWEEEYCSALYYLKQFRVSK